MKKLILLPIFVYCFVSCNKDEFHEENQQNYIQEPLLEDEYIVHSNLENSYETNALKEEKRKLWKMH